MQQPMTYDALAVTPSDTQDLVRPSLSNVAQNNTNPNFIGAGQLGTPKADLNVAYALSVGASGTVTFIDKMGNTQQVTLNNTGVYYLRATRIKATGTSATGIIAYFPVYQ